MSDQSGAKAPDFLLYYYIEKLVYYYHYKILWGQSWALHICRL